LARLETHLGEDQSLRLQLAEQRGLSSRLEDGLSPAPRSKKTSSAALVITARDHTDNRAYDHASLPHQHMMHPAAGPSGPGLDHLVQKLQSYMMSATDANNGKIFSLSMHTKSYPSVSKVCGRNVFTCLIDLMKDIQRSNPFVQTVRTMRAMRCGSG